MKNIEQLKQNNFDKVIGETKIPVMVDFWAEWCGPCRNLGPVLEQLAKENGDKVKVVKVNVDENEEIASKYGIQGIPTVKIFKNGQEIFSATGAYPKSYWQEAIDKL